MRLKYLVLYITVVGLLSCSIRKSEKNNHESRAPELIWIETTFLQSNFDALVMSKKLYYLKHMSVDYNPHNTGFWKSIDTVIIGNGIIKRLRKGACESSKDTTQIGFCIEQQEHTIDQNINKVIEFQGTGSGYIARIEFEYDKSKKLTKYSDGFKDYYLKYNKIGKLKEVLITRALEINEPIGLIKFK